jgi:hypothetical protein
MIVMKDIKPRAKGKQRAKDPSPYPKGWNRKRVDAIIEHYDSQTDVRRSPKRKPLIAMKGRQ